MKPKGNKQKRPRRYALSPNSIFDYEFAKKYGGREIPHIKHVVFSVCISITTMACSSRFWQSRVKRGIYNTRERKEIPVNDQLSKIAIRGPELASDSGSVPKANYSVHTIDDGKFTVYARRKLSRPGKRTSAQGYVACCKMVEWLKRNLGRDHRFLNITSVCVHNIVFSVRYVNPIPPTFKQHTLVGKYENRFKGYSVRAKLGCTPVIFDVGGGNINGMCSVDDLYKASMVLSRIYDETVQSYKDEEEEHENE